MFYYLCQFILRLFHVYAVFEIFICLKYVYQKLVLRFLWKPINYTDFGPWAIVTGCTDGIGKAFAVELAKKRIDLVLISRSLSKLEDLAKELNEKYNVKTKIIVADFTNSNDAITKIRTEITGMDIGILVNNVGVAYGVKNFTDCERDEVNSVIEVNIRSTVNMCDIVLPNMVKNKKGLIINSSSILSLLAAPGTSVYAASKAFILRFSKDLHSEYKKFGITVHCLTTGPVRTKMCRLYITDWFTPTPGKYVRSALKTIGMENVTTGAPSHDLYLCLSKLMTAVWPSSAHWMFEICKTFSKKVVASTIGKKQY